MYFVGYIMHPSEPRCLPGPTQRGMSAQKRVLHPQTHPPSPSQRTQSSRRGHTSVSADTVLVQYLVQTRHAVEWMSESIL